jgi:hypothetical protein
MDNQMQIWEKRYSAKEFAYGKEPNEFFARSIVGKNPGRLLVPAAGEGRDAPSKRGWINAIYSLKNPVSE